MRLVSLARRKFTALAERVSIAPKARPRGLILLYHRVAAVEVDPWQLCVSPEHFAQHLDVLKRFRPVRLSQMPECVTQGSVAVTFDDGYADNLHSAARLLQEHDIPATFFLTSGYLGGNREFWWDELQRRLASAAAGGAELELTIADRTQRWDLTRSPWLSIYYEIYDLLQPLTDLTRRGILGHIRCNERIDEPRESHRALTLSELQKLAGVELCGIGAHTVTHPRLAAHSAPTQLAEMRESKRFLESAVGRGIDTFSYPFGGPGHYSAESVRMAHQAGFSAACTTIPAPVDRTCRRLELPRVVIEDMDGDQFEQLLNGYLANRN
jgi:peptidoglycan/xylan/chitin deacetylase (PgdA/CDA1 family)